MQLTSILKKIKKDPDKRRLLENFISLSILQGANYILPLITLPYLVRVLGPEKFGLIAFAQAFIQYFNILTDYGFRLSATKEISINRDNEKKLSEIFSSVIIIKLGLLILSITIMTIIVFSVQKFKKDWLVYYLTFGIVIGQTLFPIWFFQGIEKMRYITILDLISKLIFTVLVFIFVRKTADYIYVPLLNSIGSCVSAFLSLWIVFKNFNVSFKIPKLTVIKHQLKEGWYIFISTVAISLYTISNTFILGLFTNNTIVGYYSAAEKLIKAAQGLLTPISQTIYPHISKLVKESKKEALRFVRQITFLIGGISFIISITIFIFADLIVKIFLGNQYIESVFVLRILSFLPFIVALSNIFGIQTMLTFNYKKAFSKILIIASFINILLAFILVPFYQHIGISLAVLISEIFVTVSMFLYLHKKGIKILEVKIVRLYCNRFRIRREHNSRKNS